MIVNGKKSFRWGMEREFEIIVNGERERERERERGFEINNKKVRKMIS